MADNAHAPSGGGDHGHEIIIVKHGGEEHDDHHGGAWKIAFADFMTAMMALFLVLWLTSTNNKTKSIIARYFNPVQLVDSTPQPPGLSDPSPTIPPRPKSPPPASDSKNAGSSATETHSAGSSAGESKPDSTATPQSKPPSDAQSKHDDAEMFKDPYAVLAELAAKNNTPVEKKTEQAPTEGTQGGSGAVGVRAGEAFRDPFEPLSVPAETVPDTPPPKPDDAATQHASAKAADADPQGDIAALRAKITAAMKANDKAGGVNGDPKIEVRRTDEGLLITLTDDANFSMFNVASAEPAPKMVTLMDKIGHVLKTQKGKVTIRGFTDSRPFRSDTYDNWRLSAARAHIAHYMLVRGGVDDARFERIEGYADRRPKNVKDPAGAENRRIEILLRETAP